VFRADESFLSLYVASTSYTIMVVAIESTPNSCYRMHKVSNKLGIALYNFILSIEHNICMFCVLVTFVL